MWGYRAQIDRDLYKKHVQSELFDKTPNLDVLVAPVEDLIIENATMNSNNQTCVECKGIVLSKILILIILLSYFINWNCCPNYEQVNSISIHFSITWITFFL